MKYRWVMPPPQDALVTQLSTELNISRLLAQCVVNRGLGTMADAADYLAPKLKNLSDPFRLPNMEAAVDRLFRAHAEQELVVIFGDYDVDGVTSTALLLTVLRALNWQVETYLPHRRDEGYGLSQEGVENCLAQFWPLGNRLNSPGKKLLLLAVDCGSTASTTIDWLKHQGVEVIVVDHHQISEPAPKALALVNPLVRSEDETVNGSFTGYCSAGLAFKLAHALVKKGRQRELQEAVAFDLRPLLDLVALGTVADLVPLNGENRILVAAGLEQLRDTRREGLIALKEVAHITDRTGTYEVGFQLGPRLNAAGRLESAAEALKLMMAIERSDAVLLAQSLDRRNSERQRIEKAMAEKVLEKVRARFDAARDLVIVEGEWGWHPGVVGIVASRVMQEFYRPTIIVGGEKGQGNGEMRGSGRSISGFDLARALDECDGCLVRHGGHAMAAGIAVMPEQLEVLREELNAIARSWLKPEDMVPSLRLDGEVALGAINLEALEELDQLKPTGMGNPAVQFCTRKVRLSQPVRRMGAEQQHAKLWVSDGKVTHETVWWNARHATMPSGSFDLAFAPERNTFNGRTTVQLKFLDWGIEEGAKSGI